MRAHDPSIAEALAFHSEDHLTAVNFRAKHGSHRQGFRQVDTTPQAARQMEESFMSHCANALCGNVCFIMNTEHFPDR